MENDIKNYLMAKNQDDDELTIISQYLLLEDLIGECSIKPVRNPDLYKMMSEVVEEAAEKLEYYSKDNDSIVPAQKIKGFFD